MKKLLNPEGRVAKDTEVLEQLKVVIFVYYFRVFKNQNLEKRIEASYSEEMNKIDTYCSLILETDEKFKKKKVVSEKMKNFRNIRNLVRKETHYDKVEDSSNAFENLRILQNTRFIKKHLLNKRAVSFEEKEDEPKSKEENESLFSIKEEKSDEDSNDNEKEDENEISFSESSDDENEEVDYKKLMNHIFCRRLNDFRGEILKHFLERDKEFNSFEKFVCYIEFFVMLFTGLRVKYYIDELGNLDLDFYCTEKTLMDLAETFHYQVQFRIQDIPIILQKDGTYKTRDGNYITMNQYFLTKNKKVNELNKRQFYEYKTNEVELYPPFTSFIKALADKFRRYDENDNYHICKECENFIDFRSTYNLTCSSVFRKIDKNRISYAALSTVMDFDYLKTLIHKNDSIIKQIIYLPNYDCIDNSIKFFNMVHAYSTPFRAVDTKRINRVFRTIFGEKIGFYYSWITHYVRWAVFPAVAGILYEGIKQILKYYKFKSTVFLVMNLLFATIIVLWGNFYSAAWKSREEVYNYIWGMDHFKLEKSNEIYIENQGGEQVELFMNVKIPIYDKFKELIRDIVNFVLIFSSLFGTVILNLLIFYIQRWKVKTEDGKVKSNTWLYIIPILIYIVREILSKIYAKLNKWITDKENYLTKKEYKKAMLKKQLIFEFFNYYFNLYYIAFAKNYFESCVYNDCFEELGNQLTMIIISDITVVASKTIYLFIYRRKQIKSFDKTIMAKYTYSVNSSKKYHFYTRKEFNDQDLSEVMMPVIFNFGYIIQFGISSKISFFFMLILTIFFRLATGFSMKYLVFIKNLDESMGIGIFNEVLGLMSFFGIISNLCIIFYTNKHFAHLDRSQKFFYLILTENLIFFILKLSNVSRPPNWFEFKNKVEVKYLKKYGIRSKSIMKKDREGSPERKPRIENDSHGQGFNLNNSFLGNNLLRNQLMKKGGY